MATPIYTVVLDGIRYTGTQSEIRELMREYRENRG